MHRWNELSRSKEVAKVYSPRRNPRGDLIPPFSEIANLVLAWPSRQPEVVRGELIYRSDSRYRTRAPCPLIAYRGILSRSTRLHAEHRSSEGTDGARTRRREVFEQLLPRKIARAIGSNHPAVLAPYRRSRGSLDPLQHTLFTLRFDTSVLSPHLPFLFLSILTLFIWGGVVYKLPRASYTIPAIDCSDTRKERPRREAAVLPFRDIPSRANANPSAKGTGTASWLSCCRCCCLSVSNSYSSERSETRSDSSGVPTARYPILFRSKRWNRFPLVRLVHPLRASALTWHDGGFHERRLDFKGDIVRDASLYQIPKAEDF